MLLLADENFPGDAVEALRSRAHDVVWIRSTAPGATDADVLSRAIHEKRVLLTFDKDFGELAARAGIPASTGIVLFRMALLPSAGLGSALADLLESRTDWHGHFSVIEAGRIRMRPLSPQVPRN